jgi:hypothetical protein
VATLNRVGRCTTGSITGCAAKGLNGIAIKNERKNIGRALGN